MTYSRKNARRPQSGSYKRPPEASREPSRQPARGKPRRSGETIAAVVIIGAALVSVLIVAAAVWRAGRIPEASAVPAMGAVSQWEFDPEDSSDQFILSRSVMTSAEYQQLSDPLLVLVNDNVPLPDRWQVTPAFVGDEVVDQRCYSDLDAMIQAAQADNIWLWVASGYRSVEDQEDVLQREIALHMTEDGMTQEEARDVSLKTIARPGFSEHHTGLVVDLNDVSNGFESTEEYKWLKQHAAEYGFVQRYRSDKVDKTGIDNESWHYRYVGRTHAQEMERLDMCLEEYVEYLKGQGTV